jgi:glycosyltransferase involved in cell wall biosynthesis
MYTAETLRVALVTTSYPRTRGDFAGHFVETEALALASEGHDVHVIAPGRRASVRTVERPEGPVTVWGAGGGSLFGPPGALYRAREHPLRLLELLGFVPSVVRLLRALAPVNRTIAHFLLPSGYPLALAATGDTEVVLHGSDVRVFVGLPSVVRSHVIGRLLAHGTRFRFVSEELRGALETSLRPAQRDRLHTASRVELPPIDVPIRPRSWDDRNGDTSRPRWVTCSRLIASKRVDRAIREAARSNVDLTVIGEGPLRGELEALAASLEPRARFVGHLSREKALELIADSHRLLHLSEAEGAPTVIREARALGVPVLATPVGDVARWALEDPGIEIFRPV